ncbi:hypothetical protein HMI56_002066 [Coelomomyces lativittatus]|nr:hypothetical protein HMI56_002066 [Coelomomyces lativittatus]
MVYTIVTALDATEPSFHAFDFAVDLVSNLKEYQLFVVYVTALNKTSRFPYLCVGTSFFLTFTFIYSFTSLFLLSLEGGNRKG